MTDEIGACNMAPDLPWRIDAHALRTIESGGAYHFGRDDAIFQDLLVVVDIVDEFVQDMDALLEAALDHIPLGGAHDARDQIERKDALGAGSLAIHVERDAHLQQRALGRLLPAGQLSRGERFDIPSQRPCSRPRLSVLTEHLIEEIAGFVVGESHGPQACGSATGSHVRAGQPRQVSQLL